MGRKPNKKRNTLTMIGIIALLVLLAYMTWASSRANYQELNAYYEQLSAEEAE